MAKAETRPKETPEGGGRIDSVKPPPDLPDTTPFERMRELTRRILSVPKSKAGAPPKRRPR